MNRCKSVVLSATLSVAFAVGAATSANAAPTIRDKALSTAATQKGARYVYGAAGGYSKGYDCSGLTSYAYGKHGKKIPRTAQAQYNRYTHISPSNRRKGDLIFIGTSSSNIYHVGIYAGVKNGYGLILDAPKPGRTVGFHRIVNYTAGSPKAYYARVN
jgi:cell wall-associated NlpC family hydrolase